MRDIDAFEYGKRDRPGRSGRRPADRSHVHQSPPNCALVKRRDVFGGMPKTAGETPALPGTFRTLFAGIAIGVLNPFCYLERSLGQEQTVRGLVYCAIEELDNNLIVLQGTAGSQGVAFDRLILAPNTRCQAWLLHAETLRIADVTFTRPGAGQSFQFPNFIFRETSLLFAWGAHAPSRAVFRALAEHHPASEYNQRSVTASPLDRAARAPLGTREGACTPRDGGMSV